MIRAPTLVIAAEAGEWPDERALRSIAKTAILAAVEVLGSQKPRSPLPDPSLARSGRTPASDHESSEVGNTRLRGGSESVGELSILFTNDEAVRRLNAHYRGKDKPTNVLSFPQPSGPLLGDVVLAAETVRAEAALAGKPLEAHMAHLIIHGFLHLLGYDHWGEEEAEAMEAVERAALERMGIPDPYAAASEK
jgi:probable rRNA maturation factor